MADAFADFDNDRALAHDTTDGIRVRRHPVQHSPLSMKQKEDILSAASGTGIESKEEFLVVISAAAGRRIGRLAELVDVEYFKVVSALASRKRHYKADQSAKHNHLPQWTWPLAWKPKA